MERDSRQEKRSKRRRKVRQLKKRVEYLYCAGGFNRLTNDKQFAYVWYDLGVFSEVILEDLARSLQERQIRSGGGYVGLHGPRKTSGCAQRSVRAFRVEAIGAYTATCHSHNSVVCFQL